MVLYTGAKPSARTIQKEAKAQQEYSAAQHQPFVNPNADIVERLVTTNFNPAQGDDETDQQFRDRTNRQEAGMQLADASLYQTGPVGTKPTSSLVNPFLTPQKTATTSSSDGGFIEANARERLAKAGITGEAADKQIASQKQGIQDTMTHSGQGAQYDPKTGKVIPGSGRLPANSTVSKNPQADAAAKRAAEKAAKIAGTKGYVKNTGTNEDGSTYEYYSEDPGATAEAQRQAEATAADEDLASEMQAQGYRDWLEQNAPTPPSDSFFANLPEEQRADAMSIYGPMFDYIDNATQMLKGNAADGMDAIGEIGGAMQTYVDSQRARDSAMLDRFDGFYKEQLNNQLSSADSAKDASIRNQELARDRAQFEFDRAIRDQMVQNEKNRKDQLLGLGVSGGWRSSRHSADVIDALAVGDKIVADLHTQKAFMERDFGNKFSDIESDWHSNVVSAHDKYKASSLALLDKAMTKAGELDKIVYESTKDKINAIQNLKTDFVKSYGLLARDFASTVGDMNKTMIQKAADVEKMKYDQMNKTWDQALKYVDTYGTQNKSALRIYEDKLGLMPGALSNQQTIEELKMKKSGGGSGVAGSIANRVDGKVSEILSLYPNANMNDILTMAYHELNTEVGGESAAGRNLMDGAKQYMYGKYGTQLPQGTRIETILNERTVKGEISSTYEDARTNAHYGSQLGGETVTTNDAVTLYGELVAGGMEKKDAQKFISQFGWEINDPWYAPAGAQKNK